MVAAIIRVLPEPVAIRKSNWWLTRGLPSKSSCQ